MFARQLRKAATRVIGGGGLRKRGVVTISPEVTSILSTNTTKYVNEKKKFVSLLMQSSKLG